MAHHNIQDIYTRLFEFVLDLKVVLGFLLTASANLDFQNSVDHGAALQLLRGLHVVNNRPWTL